nr:exocyst complex component 2 [Hymenolepis microstoma]
MNASPPAQVTGISPVEGVPGTKLTLRGEYFGQSAFDLTHVFVGGIDVSPSARWFSSRKLSVITPLGTGELEIVVVTKSGGLGTSELTYSQHLQQKIGPQEQVSYWPEDERRRCPAIIERGSGIAKQKGGGDVVDSSLAATGLPASEIARLGIPLSDTALMKIYPHIGSVLLSEPDFDPMLFLLKYYKSASFEDLVMARNNFSHSISESGASESSSIIKTNLYLIFRCLEGLDDLRIEMKRSNASGGTDYKLSVGQKGKSKPKEGTVETRLEKKLTDSWNQGYDLFKDVLHCREAANSARNVLSIMERFSFLFSLPESIRKTIKQGEYNLAVSDYRRANALFATSDCGAFQRVFAEIETVIADFRETLKSELLQVPIDVDEAIKRIKCLEQLDVDYDPYWSCAEAFKDWLIEQLHAYQKRYQDETKPSPETPKSPTQPVMRSNLQNRLGKQQLTIQLLKQVCSLLSTQCVQLWRLQVVCLAASSKVKSPTSERGDGQQSLQAKYQNANIEVIHLLANCIREAVLQPTSIGSLETIQSGWASTCVQEFRNCCLSLPLDIVPRDVQSVLRRLSYDLRRHAVRDVLRTSQTTVESLHFKENWEIEVTDNGGSITQLPLAYENVVVESLSRCRTLMSSRTSLEDSLFEAPEYHERFSQSFADLMVGFLSTLQHLAEQIELSISRQGTSVDAPQDGSGGFADVTGSQRSIVAQARGVLLLISNADWAARHANSRVFSAYASGGFANVEDLRMRVNNDWSIAIEKLIDLYVRIRSAWLCGPLSKEVTPDIALQSAMITTLCNLSHIHSELVLLLGVPTAVENTSNENTEVSYVDRLQPIMKSFAVRLSDAIRSRSGDVIGESDETSSQDSTEDSVAFILDLLKLLISGTSLENFLASKERAFGLKQSLRLVTKALDIGDALEEVQNGSVGGQSQRSQNRLIHRPHFHRLQKQS